MKDYILIESKVEQLLVLLEKLNSILKEFDRNRSLKEFLLYAAEKKAEEVVEQAVSINQELLKLKGKVSQSYYDSFLDLKIFKVFVERDLFELAGTAGFRNRLAHDYLEVDNELAMKSMKNMIPLYKLYLQKIRKILYTLKK